MALPNLHGHFDHTFIQYPFDLRISVDVKELEWEAEIESYHPTVFPETVFCYRIHNRYGEVMIDEPLADINATVHHDNVALLHQFLSASFIEAAKLSTIGQDDIGLSIVFMNNRAEIKVFYQDKTFEAVVPMYEHAEFGQDVDECAPVNHIINNIDFDSMMQISMKMNVQNGAVAH